MGTLPGGFTLNILLEPLLIFGVELGIAGAVLATHPVAARRARRLCGLFRSRLGRGAGARALRPAELGELAVLAVGLPATLSSALSAIAIALIYRAASRHGGDEAVAGIGIGFRLVTLGSLPVIGFCLGAQAVLSHAWGAGDPQRVLQAAAFMLRVARASALPTLRRCFWPRVRSSACS